LNFGDVGDQPPISASGRNEPESMNIGTGDEGLIMTGFCCVWSTLLPAYSRGPQMPNPEQEGYQVVVISIALKPAGALKAHDESDDEEDDSHPAARSTAPEANIRSGNDCHAADRLSCPARPCPYRYDGALHAPLNSNCPHDDGAKPSRSPVVLLVLSIATWRVCHLTNHSS